MPDSVIVWVIVACEIGFWVVVAAGMALRYWWRRRTASVICLALVPVVDIALLIAVGADLYGGGEVESVHLIAAVYLGVSVAFGHRMIHWADRWVAYRFAGGRRPKKAPKTGRAGLRYELRYFAEWLVAAAVTLAADGVLALTIATGEQARALFQVAGPLALVTVIWLVTGPLWVLGRMAVRPVQDRS